MFDHRLSKNEITLLSKICRKERSIEELAEGISYSRTSELLTDLEDKGFVTKSKGLKKTIKRAKTEHAQEFCKLITLFPHIDWKEHLSDSKVQILTQICHSPSNTKELADITGKTNKTVRNNLKKPLEIGMVKRSKEKYEITGRFTPCCSFLKSWRYFYDISLIENIAPNSTIVWQGGLEFIIESESPIEQGCFVETGPSILTKLDDQLVYRNHTYIFTNRTLKTKDHLKNALRVAPRNQRILNSVEKISKERSF